MHIKKIAILFSGNGSNLEAILEKVHNKIVNDIKFEVALTLTNKKDAFGIVRARKYGIESIIIEHKNFKTRELFDQAVVNEIKKHNVDLVVLAGFMRILSPVFTNNVKAINLHPSLLPLFKGANAIKESYESDMKIGGVSVHYVSSELDGGEIIAQSVFQKEDKTLEEFEDAIHKLEHQILPDTIIKILSKN